MKMEKKFEHIPVLLKESIQGLNIRANGIYVDGTLGGAGHSLEILKNINSEGLLIGIDRDEEALEVAKERLKKYKNVIFVKDNHDNIEKILQDLNIEKVDGILLDLGVSSYQIDEKARGFSYIGDAQLDMRMDKEQKISAKNIVNEYSQERLANIIFDYGEERYARQIAKNICEYRENKQIETTKELVDIIEKSVPAYIRHKDGHPAKKTFQAIRIEVNDELKPLYNTVISCINKLNSGGRLCIITFHSLEDRIVKQAYNNCLGKCTCPSDLPYCVCNKKKLGKLINRKPIVPSEEEIKYNTRSKSAKLRIFERN